MSTYGVDGYGEDGYGGDTAFWRFEYETESGTDDIVFSGIQATTPTLTAGTEITVTLFLRPDESGETSSTRYTEFLPFFDVDGSTVLRYGVSDDGVPWFRERYPESMPVESLLVAMIPHSGIIDARGWWGLLVGVEDSSQPVETDGFRRLEATFFVLARYGEYDTHSDVRTTFANQVLG